MGLVCVCVHLSARQRSHTRLTITSPRKLCVSVMRDEVAYVDAVCLSAFISLIHGVSCQEKKYLLLGIIGTW